MATEIHKPKISLLQSLDKTSFLKKCIDLFLLYQEIAK